jgi:hypothetical protein
MEELWRINRQQLRESLRAVPNRCYAELAEEVGCSLSWVKKWAPYLKANLQDDRLLARRQSPRAYAQPARSAEVIAKILEIRDHPPCQLRRTPGPRAILYYLGQDPELRALGVRLPRSTRTVWQVLDQYQRIARRPPVQHEPLPPVAPLRHWQFDFKDATTAHDETSDKRLHQVEILNIVDSGTSLVVDDHVSSDFNAETAIIALVSTFLKAGLPDSVRFDRDPRFVGAQQTRDFPSALTRLLACLGVTPILCPPQRPDKNPYVERYHRALSEEALQREQPADVAATRACVTRYREHYNLERPNQARSCANRPPAVAFPTLPTLRQLPLQVEPDAWLGSIDGRLYRRRVNAAGSVQIGQHCYYVRQRLRGQLVLLKVKASAQVFEVFCQGQRIKEIPIKGLHSATMAFQDYLRLICKEAISEARQLKQHRQHRSTI